MQKIFFALRAISYEGTQTCDRFTKNVESADRFTKNVDVDVDVERRVLVPRPLLVSGSPFLPPLSKRVSLLKFRPPRPPAETAKIFYFFSIFFLFFLSIFPIFACGWSPRLNAARASTATSDVTAHR